jgi:hypothetical protein
MTLDANGNPIAMWIRLTVAGMSRLGVGTCPSGQFETEKVLIGDAIRNAAMRFGVALNLWIKGHAEDDERAAAESERQVDRVRPAQQNLPGQEQPAAAPAPDVVTLDEIQPYMDEVTAMSQAARERLVVLWTTPGTDGKVTLPTREKDGATVPAFGKLRREQIVLVEALIARAKRDVENVPGPRDEEKPSEPESESQPEPQSDPQSSPAGDEETIDWAVEAREWNRIMRDAKARLPEGEGEAIAAEVWALRSPNAELKEAGDPRRPDEPVDVARMRLVCLRIEDKLGAREGPRPNETSL